MLLELHELRKEYRRSGQVIVALDNVSLDIRPGEVLGLLGPNGAGKTTLVKCSCGLVAPDAGHVSVAGHDLGEERAKALGCLGAVLEGSRNIYWQLSPRENLWYFGRMRGLSDGVIASRSGALLARLGLVEVADAPVKGLSRGTQQRAAVAVALLHDPNLLLLDEPTLGLDLASTEAVAAEVRRLAHDEGKGILLTTHQFELAEELCDRLAVISRGRLLLCQPTPQVLRQFEQQQVALIVIEGALALADRLRLADAYSGLEFVQTPEGETLKLAPFAGVSPEELFVALWQAGYSVRSYRRTVSLREVYQRLVSHPSDDPAAADVAPSPGGGATLAGGDRGAGVHQ